MTNVVFRVPRTTPGLALNNDKTGLTFRKELIYENLPGETFKKKTADHDQEFTVDEDRLDHWCNVGNTMLHNGVKVPVPLKHTDEPEKNRGQVLRFERGTNEEGREALFGVIKFRDAEAAKLAASTDVSIFVPDKPVYDGFGNEYIQPIRHVCCTDYPVIPKLGGFEAIAASLELSSEPKRQRTYLDTLTQNLARKGASSAVDIAGITGAALSLRSPKIRRLLHKVYARRPGLAVGTGIGLLGARQVAKFIVDHEVQKHYDLSLSSKPVADHIARKPKGLFAKARAYHEAGKVHGFMGADPPNKVLPRGKSIGARLQGMAEVLGDPVGHLRKRAEAAVNTTRQAVHEEIDKGMRHAVNTIRQESKSAIHEEVQAIKQRIKGLPKELAGKAIRTIQGVPRRAFKLARNPIAVAAIGGALGVHYAKQRVSDYVFGKRKPKDISASLELAIPTRVKRQLQKAADFKVTLPRRTKNFDRNARIISAVLAGSAVAHLIHKHMLQPQSEVSASLELAVNSAGQVINSRGQFTADPNSKASLRAKNRELRQRQGEYGGSVNSTTGVPDLRTAIENAKFRINDFYHASKEELAAPANALHASKHVGAALLHGMVAAGAIIAAKRFGTKGIAAYKANKNTFNHVAGVSAAATAAAGSVTGLVDHLEAAGQHVYAGLNKRRKK